MGYGPKKSLWELETNIHAEELIKSFKRIYLEKKCLFGHPEAAPWGGNVRKLYEAFRAECWYLRVGTRPALTNLLH